MGIKSGLNNVKKVYLGSTPVKEIYHGVNLVYSFERGDLSLWRYSNNEIAGKTLLYEYLGSYNNLPDNTLYVPRVGGKAVINCYDRWNSNNSPFYSRYNLVKVDLQKVPFLRNGIEFAFRDCRNLTTILNFPDFSSISMYYTFSGCYNFNQNVQIYDSVTNLHYTFEHCNKLNQNIRIPNNVADMGGTFAFCYNFNQSTQIPKSVTTMSQTFMDCNNFNCNISIPNSVTDISYVIEDCNKYNSWINIYSEKIINNYAKGSFNTNNSTNPKVPNVIFPARYINNKATLTQLAIKNAGWTVFGIGVTEGKSPNQIRSWDVIKGNYNTFKGNGTHWELHKWNGALAKALNNGVTVTDVVVPEYFTTYDTFPSALNYPCFRRNDSLTSVDFGCEIPWVGNKMGNQTNSKNDATRVGAFDGCNSMTSIKGVVHPNVTQMVDAFSDSINLTYTDVILPEGVTNCVGVYYNSHSISVPAPLPSTVTTVWGMFSSSTSSFTGNLSNSFVVPPSVTTMTNLFRYRQENVGNVYVLSSNLASDNKIANFWGGYPKTFKKSVYIYYQYSNGVNTATYELFKKKAVFYGTSGNGAGVNPMYNSTSNFYVYDLSSVYNNLWNHTIYLSSSQKLVKLLKYKGSDKHVALMSNYPDFKPHIFDVNCFNNCRNIVTLALYDANIYAPAGNCMNMFRNCYNLRIIQGLKLDKVTTQTEVSYNYVSLANTFENCYNLRVMANIPSTVKNMYYTFKNCNNFDFNVQIKDGVTSMVGTFSGCSNLNKGIKIPNTVTNISDIFYGCYNLNQEIQIPANVTNMKNSFYSCRNLSGRINVLSNIISDSSNSFMGTLKFKEVHIPYKYSNGVNSRTFNSFVSAGYLYSNGVSTGKNNTRFYNIVL